MKVVISHTLRSLISQRGVTLHHASELLGVSYHTLCSWVSLSNPVYVDIDTTREWIQANSWTGCIVRDRVCCRIATRLGPPVYCDSRHDFSACSLVRLSLGALPHHNEHLHSQCFPLDFEREACLIQLSALLGSLLNPETLDNPVQVDVLDLLSDYGDLI